MEEEKKYQNLFSPLNASIPDWYDTFYRSLKNTYERVIPFMKMKLKKS